MTCHVQEFCDWERWKTNIDENKWQNFEHYAQDHDFNGHDQENETHNTGNNDQNWNAAEPGKPNDLWNTEKKEVLLNSMYNYEWENFIFILPEYIISIKVLYDRYP